MIFAESYYPTIHVFHSSYKPLLTNKRIKTFAESLSNNLSIFESYYQITLSFSEFTSANKHFQRQLLLILQTIFR